MATVLRFLASWYNLPLRVPDLTTSPPDKSILEPAVLLLQLLELCAGCRPLHSRVANLLLDDLQVDGELLNLLLQSLSLCLLTLTLSGRRKGGRGRRDREREGGREGGREGQREGGRGEGGGGRGEGGREGGREGRRDRGREGGGGGREEGKEGGRKEGQREGGRGQ